MRVPAPGHPDSNCIATAASDGTFQPFAPCVLIAGADHRVSELDGVQVDRRVWCEEGAEATATGVLCTTFLTAAQPGRALLGKMYRLY